MVSITGIFLLAMLIERFVELFIKPIEKIKPFVAYIAIVLGIAVSLAYGIDIPAMAGLTAGYVWVGQVISGIIIGGGSNYVNEVISFIRSLTTTRIADKSA